MDIKKIIEINEIIKSKRALSPKSIAVKLNLSERTVYAIVKFMKEELNAPIKYNRSKMRYGYEEEGYLNLKWQHKK